MGIRQLQTFMQESVSSGYIDISIIEECEQYRRLHNEKPIIVIDLMGLLSYGLINRCEMLCGGRHNILREFYENLFRKLAKYADLVFFEDGPVASLKMETWYRRQNQSYNDQIYIIEAIYKQKLLSVIPIFFQELKNYTAGDRFKAITNQVDLPNITTHVIIIEELAQKYGELTLTVTTECDAEIARYASLNPRVAFILADDTDFLIFAGNWKYISIKDMNYNTLKTKEYSRDALRNFLDLNDRELVILSTLNGNDVVHYDEAKGFHSRFLANQQFWKSSVRFPALAKLIKRNLPTENHDQLVNALAMRIYGQANALILAKIEQSLNFYNLDFSIRELSDPVLRFCRENRYNFVFAILQKLPKTFISTYFDMRVEDFPNYSDAVLKLFRKQAGVVMKSARRAFRLEAVVKKFHEEPYRATFVEPIIPTIDTPPIDQLLQRDQFPHHDAVRFQLVKWTINEKGKLRNIDLERIPQNYLHDVLILTYLITERFIDKKEADIILLSIKYVEENSTPAAFKEHPRVLDLRGFRIAFLFAKYHLYVQRSFEVTGLKKLAKVINFDGVVFNNLYIYYQQNQNPFNAGRLLGDVAQYRVYA